MPSPQDKRELKGLARSVDALFSEEETEPSERPPPSAEAPSVEPQPTPELTESSEDLVWEEVPAEPPRQTRASRADPRRLRTALFAFLASDPLEREGLGRAVREAAAALRDARDFEPIADAVERLVTGGEELPDEASVAMARVLLSPGVANRFIGRLATERDEERRAALIEVCARLGPEFAVAISEELSETTDRAARRAYVDTLLRMGEEATPVIRSMLDDDRWYVVRNGVAVVGEAGADDAIELIMPALGHEDGRVRREAVHALAKLGGEDAAALVMGLLEDPDGEVRQAAASAVGRLGVDRGLKPLLQMLEGERESEVVKAAVKALGELGDPGAVPSIEKRAVGSILSRSPTDVRVTAYRALHRIGTPHAKSLLVKAANDKDDQVKGVVRELLRMR